VSLLSIVASPVWASVTGGLGVLGTGVLKYFQTKQEFANRLALEQLKLDEMRMMGELDQAKFAANMALARETGAAEAFTKSIEADAAAKGESRWVRNLRGATRPGLTWLYQACFLLILAFALIAWWRAWCEAYHVIPIVEYMISALVNLATMAFTWWFGQRQMDRVAISWGNKTFNGNVTPTPPAQQPIK
jgi:hypothetical protein